MRGERETHPAFARIVMSKPTQTPGASLFDSEIRHQHYITLKIERASRVRDLNNDWIFGGEDLIEVAMSASQWGALVSSFGDGSGTPVTLRYFEGKMIADPPFKPRAALSTQEVTDAAGKIFEDALATLAVVEARPTKANLKNLRHAMEAARGNVRFAAEQLTEFTEKTVARIEADIEAAMRDYGDRTGIATSTTNHTEQEIDK